MARTGRPRKPAPLRILEGNPGKRPIPALPEIPPSIPSRPEKLAVGAKRMWTRVVAELRALGLVHALDREALALLCAAADEALGLEADLLALREAPGADGRPVGAMGLVVYTDKGFAMQHPLVQQRNAAVARFHALAKDFGLTPAAREGLLKREAAKAPADPLAEFLAKKGG